MQSFLPILTLLTLSCSTATPPPPTHHNLLKLLPFFNDILKLAETEPILMQDLFESVHFLQAATLSRDEAGLKSAVFNDSVTHMYNDPCVWDLLSNTGATITHIPPVFDSKCGVEVATSVKNIDDNGSKDLDLEYVEVATSLSILYDRPPFPPSRTQSWLSARYKKHYARLTQIPKMPKTIDFRAWKYSGVIDDTISTDNSVIYDLSLLRDAEDLSLLPDEVNEEETSYLTHPRLLPDLEYDPNTDTVLQLIKIRQVSEIPKVYVVDNFASEDEIERLIKINNEWMFYKKKDTTGASFEMPVNIDPVPYRISQRMAALVKMKNDMGGTLRTRLYKKGESHPPHVDWFEIDILDMGGNKKKSNLIATAMLNLITTKKGGETEFLDARPVPVKVKPVRGQLVLWWSCTQKGEKEQDSLHQGNKIIKGKKFTVTQFFYNPLSSCLSLDDFYKPSRRKNEFDDDQTSNEHNDL